MLCSAGNAVSFILVIRQLCWELLRRGRPRSGTKPRSLGPLTAYRKRKLAGDVLSSKGKLYASESDGAGCARAFLDVRRLYLPQICFLRVFSPAKHKGFTCSLLQTRSHRPRHGRQEKLEISYIQSTQELEEHSYITQKPGDPLVLFFLRTNLESKEIKNLPPFRPATYNFLLSGFLLCQCQTLIPVEKLASGNFLLHQNDGIYANLAPAIH